MITRQPVRVLFLSHDSSMFGAQRALLTLLSGIDRRIVTPILVVPYDGELSRSASELDIPAFVEPLIHWIPNSQFSPVRKRLRHCHRFFKSLHSRCRAMEKRIVDHGVDLVYTNTVTCVEGAIAAQRTRKPHVWHIHEHIKGNKELAPMFPEWIYRAGIKTFSKSVIFCSRSLAEGYPRISGKSSVVYNGLPLPTGPERREARAWAVGSLGIREDDKLVAIVGALHPRKDLLTFLAAAKLVAERVNNSVFLIVGVGFENHSTLVRQRIQELQLEEKVKLLGWRRDIYDLMAATDVLVISSEQESFGLTAIEALAMGTPVVATRCGGPEEVVVDGENGFLVPVKDPNAMADSVVKILSDEGLARRLGSQGKIFVSNHFGIQRYVQEIQQVIVRTV